MARKNQQTFPSLEGWFWKDLYMIMLDGASWATFCVSLLFVMHSVIEYICACYYGIFIVFVNGNHKKKKD